MNHVPRRLSAEQCAIALHALGEALDDIEDASEDDQAAAQAILNVAECLEANKDVVDLMLMFAEMKEKARQLGITDERGAYVYANIECVGKAGEATDES